MIQTIIRMCLGAILCAACSSVAQAENRLLTLGDCPYVREGDLLFVAQLQDNAITRVTQGTQGLLIDHVAILHRIGGDSEPLCAIEAVPRQGVVITPIDSLVSRERDATLVLARVEGVDACRSVHQALAYVGRPYDYLFLPGDSAIYCSELVQLSCFDSFGRFVFGTIPMSFHDASGRVADDWVKFYARYGMTVPEGLPGTNPGELSRDPKVKIIMLFTNAGGGGSNECGLEQNR